ncbi:MAG: aminoacyl-tRNA hydrolase [Alphaproteobacteria bacterium]|nr:aminoacyl-tRNA hydrolase [Alphaproteobacteria bacterium]
MWLLAGLGNPGDKYANNRHNVGFMAIDEIGADHGFPPYRAKFQGVFSQATLGGEKTVLLKPMTMMNNSGQSVAAAAKFFKIPPERIVVFHDEIDLAPGKLKVKPGGGHAGHNGLRSIDAHLGDPNYWRVRIGVGHPGDKEKVYGHVLGDFSKNDIIWLEPLLKKMSEHAPMLVQGRMNDFASRLSG